MLSLLPILIKKYYLNVGYDTDSQFIKLQFYITHLL